MAVAPQRLEDPWKAKLNANTLAIIAGSPEETSLDIAHDLAVVLNNDDLREFLEWSQSEAKKQH